MKLIIMSWAVGTLLENLDCFCEYVVLWHRVFHLKAAPAYIYLTDLLGGGRRLRTFAP